MRLKIKDQPVVKITKIGFDLNGTLALRIGDTYFAYPGAIACVRALKGEGVALALVSDSSPTIIDRILGKMELCREQYFAVVVSGNDLEYRRKPDPYAWKEAARVLRVEGDGLAIENTPDGVRSAVEAGWLVAAIKSTSSVKELENAGACVVVESFSELLGLLEEEEGDE